MEVEVSDVDTEKVFCTKYALTTGVYEVSGREDGKYFQLYKPNGHYIGLLCRGQWARTADEAIEQVKRLVARRQQALAKERAKLTGVAVELAAGVLPMKVRA